MASSLSLKVPTTISKIAAAQQADGVFKETIQQLEQEQPVTNPLLQHVAKQLCVSGGLLQRNVELPIDGPILVPVLPPVLEEQVLGPAHTNTGHAGWETMYGVLRKCCYFPSMAVKCQQRTRDCQRRQAANARCGPAAAPSRPDIPGRTWSTVQIDTLGLDASKSADYHCVLVCVDVFTKWAEVVPLRRHDARV